MQWYVYILSCADGIYYTGITTDLNRRVDQHNSKKGAKSLRGKLPVKIVYNESYKDHVLAAKREREIKGWRREKKTLLVEDFSLRTKEGFSLRSKATKAR